MAATSRERESALLSALTLVERARALSGQAILVRRPSKLPWNIIELLTSSRDEAGFNATQVPPGRPSPVQLSWGAVPFQGKAQIPAQVRACGVNVCTAENGLPPRLSKPVASFLEPTSWHPSNDRKHRRAVIEPSSPPGNDACPSLAGSMSFPQKRTAVLSTCPSPSVRQCPPPQSCRLPSRSSSPSQSVLTKENNEGGLGLEGEPALKRACLFRPPATATLPLPSTAPLSFNHPVQTPHPQSPIPPLPTDHFRLPGSNLLTPLLPCRLCGQQRPSGLMSAHLKLECPSYVASCPQEHCTWEGPRQLLKMHLDEICGWVLVRCPFDAPGWPALVPRGLVRKRNDSPVMGAHLQPEGENFDAMRVRAFPVAQNVRQPVRVASHKESLESDEDDDLRSDADSAWPRQDLTLLQSRVY